MAGEEAVPAKSGAGAEAAVESLGDEASAGDCAVGDVAAEDSGVAAAAAG